MADQTIDELLKEDHASILAAVRERMRGDETMGAVAAVRELSEGDLTAQVLDFWLQGIRTDLALGITHTMQQNLEWLVAFRAGHELPFDGRSVAWMFAEISDEILARLPADDLRAEYETYAAAVRQLIAQTFPA